jgi:hypothetical protein
VCGQPLKYEREFARVMVDVAKNYEAFGPGLFTVQAGVPTEVSVSARLRRERGAEPCPGDSS